MSQQLRIGRRGWRRVIGAAAGLTVLGAALLVPLTSADATMVATPARTKNIIDGHDRVGPPGVRSARALPAPGAYGPAFPTVSSSKDGITPRITGGVAASSADFPSVVGIESLYWNFQQSAWFVAVCSGTVLSPTKVLTAGHCTVDLPFGTTVVIAGRDNLANDSSGFVARVSATWTHQSFNFTATSGPPIDDVAVLTLRDPLPSAYPPITLNNGSNPNLYQAGTSATIVGYGESSSNAGDFGVLRKATTPIGADADCTSALPSFDTNRMLCAGAPQSGIDTCGGDSGGPIFVGTTEIGITDWGLEPCGSTFGVYEDTVFYKDAIAEDIARPAVVNLDWTGDGHSDLFSRRSNGDLLQWTGTGFANDGRGGFAGTSLDGAGWSIYTKLFRVTNWNNDGKPSVMGRDSAGRLFLYKGTGDGFFDGDRIQVGNGWNMFSDIMVVNNWTGDGHPNLMGRTPTGDLFLYTSDGQGGWLNNGIGIKIGTGWNMFKDVLTPGPWRGDGFQSLIGRTSTGDLFLYTSDGHGGWQNSGVGIKIGTGWNMFTTFMSPGDWNGDDMIDMLGIQPDGTLKLYKTDAHGNWLDNGMGQVIGSGWNQFTAVF